MPHGIGGPLFPGLRLKPEEGALMLFTGGAWVTSLTFPATSLSGIVPPANGGTGINNGTFTLTVPATGTAALLGVANTFTLVNTFSNTANASTSLLGAVVIGNGVAATSIGLGAGNFYAGGNGRFGGTLAVDTTSTLTGNVGVGGGPATNVTINSDKTYTTETSPVRGAQFIARLAITADNGNACYGGRFDAYATANFNYTAAIGLVGVYGRAQNVSAAGANVVTGAVGGYFDIVNSPTGTISDAYTLRAGAATLSAGAITRLYGLYVDAMTVGGTNYAIYTNAGLVRLGDTTDATAIGTAAVVELGGHSTAKRSFLGTIGSTFKGNVDAGVQDATAAVAGQVGEVISSSVTAAAVAASGTVGNVTSISLTAGDWLISGNVVITGGATGLTSGSTAKMSIVTTSATNGTSGSTMAQESVLALLANGLFEMSLAHIRVNTNATATYYLTEEVSYVAGSPTVAGTIIATRMR